MFVGPCWGKELLFIPKVLKAPKVVKSQNPIEFIFQEPPLIDG